jgi:hypothetical protein
MAQFYIEGVYATLQGVKKKQKTGSYPANSIEPYAMTIWADNPEEALRLATEELGGGEWIEKPKISQVTEEQRMRLQGEPEFPGFSISAPKPKKHK